MRQKTVRLLQAVRREYGLYLLFLVPLIWYLVFMYYPLYGLQIAFRRFNARLGIAASPWVGGLYFKQFFNSYYFKDLLLNTLILNIYQMALGFPVPILLALVVNEIRCKPLQKAVQNVTYIPYFLSMVVVVSMLTLFSNPNYGTLIPLALDDETLMNIYHNNFIRRLGEPRPVCFRAAADAAEELRTLLENGILCDKDDARNALERANFDTLTAYFSQQEE